MVAPKHIDNDVMSATMRSQNLWWAGGYAAETGVGAR